MTKPYPASPIDWSYPPEAAARGAGTLSVRCVITEEGRAEECQPLTPLPSVDQWAIGKLEGASFVPATRDGKPVRSSYVFNVRFEVPAGFERPTSWRPPLDAAEMEACKGSNAQDCLTAALRFLTPDGGARELDRASRLLGSSCAAGLSAACHRLDEGFQPPRLLEEVPPAPIDFTGAEGEVICWISPSGKARDCAGPDSAQGRWFIGRLVLARFAPATFEGEPFETEYVVRFSFKGRR